MKFNFDVEYTQTLGGRLIECLKEETGTLEEVTGRYNDCAFVKVSLAGLEVANKRGDVWHYSEFASRVSPSKESFVATAEGYVGCILNMLEKEQEKAPGITRRAQQLSEIGDCLDGLKEMLNNLQSVRDMMYELAED